MTRRPRGVTLVEVVIAAGVLLIVAAGLLEAVGYARRCGGVLRHRTAAAAAARDGMEAALASGWLALPLGTSTATVTLEPGVPCTVTTTVTTATTFLNVQGLRHVNVRAAWTEPLLKGAPVQTVVLDSYLGDPVP